MTISRQTLPQEFYDIVSAKMLLAPEPQYVHALLAKMALGAALSEQAGPLGLPGRDIPYGGAPMLSLEEQRLAMADPIMGEAVVSVAELGAKGVGHTVRLNRPVFADTTYTQASRAVSAGQVISTTPVDISAEQVAITLQRFAGPYDSTNSRVAPFSIDELDNMKAVHSLANHVGKQLKRDFDKFLDKVTVLLMDAAATTVYPSGFAADNDITAAGTAPLTVAQIWDAQKELAESNIPMFADGTYAFVVSPQGEADLKNDSAYQRLAVFDASVNPLLKKSYRGSIGPVKIFVSNTLSSAANSSSVTVYRAQMFGPGMVGMGLGRAPRVLSSADDNFGLQAKVIWELLAGFQTLDNRFGVSVRHG